jgi:hypothetical protein
MSGREFDKLVGRRFRSRLPGPARAASEAGAANRDEEIRELAEAVADEHCPKGRIEPRLIARAHRITFSFGKYGDGFDGMLEYRAGRFHIFCNVERVGPPETPRARFTLAHELGHYYLDDHRCAIESGVPPHRSQCDSESPILVEQEADLFAAELLMPSGRFLSKGRRVATGMAGILSLAEEFGTSVTSTAIRYAAADVTACAVVKWEWKGYAWKRLSSSAFRSRLRRTFEAPRDLAEDSPTRRTLAGEAPPTCGYFEAGTTASAWFPGVGGEDLRNLIFIEQAMPLGRYGVLTFLHLSPDVSIRNCLLLHPRTHRERLFVGQVYCGKELTAVVSASA